MSAITDTTAAHPDWPSADPWLDLDDIGEPDGFTESSGVDAWLERMWGIRLGESSPVTQPLTQALDAGIAEWLYR